MWALDLGTTNSLLAHWNEREGRPYILDLPNIARRPAQADPLEAPHAVPSMVHVLDSPTFWARLGGAGFFARAFFLGRLARIGREALELNPLRERPSFVPSFKRALSTAPLMPVARTATRNYSAREVAWLFMRELLAEAKRATGSRIRELVITSPVETFETYRAELASIGRSLGVRSLRFLDEPVAAALGYGLGISRKRHVLVADFGGGTFHLALVAMHAAEAREGRCEVIAKAGLDVGGNLVDQWLLEAFCARLQFPLASILGEDAPLWRRAMLAEACRVKEAVYFSKHATFDLPVPENLRRFEARVRGEATSLEVTQADLVQVLTERGLYSEIEACLRRVLSAAAQRGVTEDAVDDVLMVGGSTLLPKIYPLFEKHFGRDRVRAWQPFEAVGFGGAVFAARRIEPADFIVHDYALVTHDAKTNEPQYTVIVPRGTRFPTRTDLWKRQLVPTCALGEPERIFKLVVCEVGATDGGRRFSWDDAGQVHKVDGAHAAPIVKLNEANPALGHLNPPHSPRDTRPRLEVAFGVNADRWLCTTVYDLVSSKFLMRDEPVVRLL
jgi:molecular chaperone DnaK (HSP70)